MAYSFDTTAVIKPDVVRSIIKDAVERQTGRSVANVEFNMEVIGRDNYKNDGTLTLTGVTVRFLNDADSSATSWINRNSLASQIDSIERDTRAMGDK